MASGVVMELPRAAAANADDVSPSFVIHHPKDRLVVDLSGKNVAMEDRPFRYDDIPRYTSQLSPGDHLFSWDIQDAFFHIPLSPADQRRLAFRVGNRVFYPLVLPFGMKLSPFVFTKVMRPIVAALRRMGLAILAYMDDFCGRAAGPAPIPQAVATLARVRVLELFSSLGVTVHPAKGAVVGTTAMPILGYIIDTVRRLILLPHSRLGGVVAAAQSLSTAACGASRRVSLKELQRFTGKAVSCSLALPAGRLYLQRLYAAQKGNLHRRSVRLTHGAVRDLSWWRRLATSPDVGRALWPPTLGRLTTDASPYGWGGHWNGLVPARGFFSAAHRPLHINVKEVEAVTLSLLSLSPLCPLTNGAIDLVVDSRVALSCISAFSSRSPALTAALKRLYAVCRRLGLTLRASWIASVANLWADRLSRDRDRTDWRLCPRIFRRLDARYGPHEVDLFATSLNAHCARFFSLPASPGCDAVDALAQDWSLGNLWANPPFSLIPLVLSKVAADGATVTIVLPVWQSQPWWEEAVSRADEAYLLPRSAGLFSPGRTQVPNPHPHWRAAAFRFVRGGKPWPTRGAENRPPPWPTPLAAAAFPPLP